MANPPPSFGSPVEADPMAKRQMIVQKYAVPMYRKPTGKELRSVAPDESWVNSYRNFLERGNSGIFKLLPDRGCAESSKVVNASEVCLKYTMPGAGNSYSFRTETYRIKHLADLTYSGGNFLITGVLMQGFMTDLGDVPIDGVNLDTQQIAVLRSFDPVVDFHKAEEVDRVFTAGLLKNGLLYRRSLPAIADHTYAMRAVAYQGKIMRSVEGADYNELDFDKRRDIIVVFRVVGISTDGAATIVWTKLASIYSPKLKLPPKKSPDQLAENKK